MQRFRIRLSLLWVFAAAAMGSLLVAALPAAAFPLHVFRGHPNPAIVAGHGLRVTPAQRLELVAPGQDPDALIALRRLRSQAPRLFVPSQVVPGFTLLHSFNLNDGAAPLGALLQGLCGFLYGEAFAGGAGSQGVVFRAGPAGSSAFADLHGFAGPDGATPQGGLRNLIGDLLLTKSMYGVTSTGGRYNMGTVFRVTPSGGFQVLHSFTGGADGANPVGRLLLFVDGNYYGTTSAGAAGFGTVFRITPSGQLTTLYTFTGGNDGGAPLSGLSVSINGFVVNGALFGTTSTGGTGGGGTVFAILPTGQLTTVYNFTNGLDGAVPSAELIPDFNGNLFGTASAGGSAGVGTVFEVQPNGTFAVLHDFAQDPMTGLYPGGAVPLAALAMDFAGNLYGTAASGGANSLGTVFKVTPGGGFAVLHVFSGPDGATPQGPILVSLDGNLYGTTTLGGANGYGTIFALPHQ
jgi:uncharacterized repeat protein (TIGR03803 family)